MQFRPDGTELSFLALLDTGAHYCILNSSVVDEIGEQIFAKPLGFEATVFVSPDWHGQCFIGYTGVLDRLCFAINPRDNRFYFGPLR